MQESAPAAIDEADHMPSHKMVESTTATAKSSVVTFGGPKKSFDSVVDTRRDNQLRPAHTRKPATPRPLHSTSGGPVANLQPPAPKTPRGAARADEEASSSLKTFRRPSNSSSATHDPVPEESSNLRAARTKDSNREKMGEYDSAGKFAAFRD